MLYAFAISGPVDFVRVKDVEMGKMAYLLHWEVVLTLSYIMLQHILGAL